MPTGSNPRVTAVGDRKRVATRLLRLAVEQRVSGGVDALHLVEHDALVDERIARLLELVVPAFLREDRRVAPRARPQHRVEIDVHEVVEVLGVLARDRVARAVGVGKGVQEGLQRALEQLPTTVRHESRASGGGPPSNPEAPTPD